MTYFAMVVPSMIWAVMMVEMKIDLGRFRTEEEVEVEDKRKGLKTARGILINVISSCLFWLYCKHTHERMKVTHNTRTFKK
jgi:hypothetical protein